MLKRMATELTVLTLIAGVIALFGPFGTFDLPLGQRLLSWLAWLVIGYVAFRPSGVVGNWLCRETGWHAVIGRCIAVFAGAFPAALAIGSTMVTIAPRPAFWALYAYVVITGLVVIGLMALLLTKQDAADRPVPPIAPLPIRLDGAAVPNYADVIALKGEDHYVRFIAAGDNKLLLIRLRDAIALMPHDGLQIHRSWWVARAGVAGVRRDGRSAVIQLTDGQSIPVARSKLPILRRAGWI